MISIVARLVPAISFVVFLVSPSTLFSQTWPYSTPTMPKGTIAQWDATKRETLISILRGQEKQWSIAARKFYFGDTYDKRLPDLVIYIDSGNAVRGASLQEDGSDDRTAIFGQKSCWVIIFSESDLTVPDSVTKEKVVTDSINTVNGSTTTVHEFSRKRNVSNLALTVHRHVLAYEKGPRIITVSSILGGIINAFAGTSLAGSQAAAGLSDTSKDVKLDFLGDETKDKSHPLYAVVVKFDLAMNSYNRIELEPVENSPAMTRFTYYDYNFVNADASLFGSSVGVGYSLANRNVNAFVLFHLYLSRSLKPVTCDAFSLVGGLDIGAKDHLFDHFVLGVRTTLSVVSEPLGSVGVFYGFSSLNQGDRIKWLFCVGIDSEL